MNIALSELVSSHDGEEVYCKSGYSAGSHAEPLNYFFEELNLLVLYY